MDVGTIIILGTVFVCMGPVTRYTYTYSPEQFSTLAGAQAMAAMAVGFFRDARQLEPTLRLGGMALAALVLGTMGMFLCSSDLATTTGLAFWLPCADEQRMLSRSLIRDPKLFVASYGKGLNQQEEASAPPFRTRSLLPRTSASHTEGALAAHLLI